MTFHSINQSRHLIILCCLFFVFTVSSRARQPEANRKNWATIQNWAIVPWTNSDKPYLEIRETIDNAIASGRKPLELVFLYENPARQHPNDPIANFKWAYAAYKAAKQTDDSEGERILGEPRKALILAPFPSTYEYARLIFLTEDYLGMPTIQLQEVAKRLIKHNPNDKDIKYAAARNLIYSSRASNRDLAYKLEKELLTKYPEWAAPHGLQGYIYYSRWQTTKNAQDGNTAIAEYQNYLRLDNLKNNDFRKQVQDVIKEIEKG